MEGKAWYVCVCGSAGIGIMNQPPPPLPRHHVYSSGEELHKPCVVW